MTAGRKDATTIALTLEKAAVGTVTVRYLYGCLPDVTGLVKDNSPLQLPLLPTNGAIPVQAFADAVAKGDVNGNGTVEPADALMALQAATGKITLTPEQETAADVDGQNGVTANDALLILQYATQKINAL